MQLEKFLKLCLVLKKSQKLPPAGVWVKNQSTCRYERSPGPLGGAPLAGAPPAPWVRAQPEKYLRPPMGVLRQVLDIVWQLFRVSAGSAVRARFVINKRIFSIEHKYCLHFPRFSFSDSGFFLVAKRNLRGVRRGTLCASLLTRNRLSSRLSACASIF